eukprot:1193353-Prorocentrum_minimum.AAC.3
MERHHQYWRQRYPTKDRQTGSTRGMVLIPQHNGAVTVLRRHPRGGRRKGGPRHQGNCRRRVLAPVAEDGNGARVQLVRELRPVRQLHDEHQPVLEHLQAVRAAPPRLVELPKHELADLVHLRHHHGKQVRLLGGVGVVHLVDELEQPPPYVRHLPHHLLLVLLLQQHQVPLAQLAPHLRAHQRQHPLLVSLPRRRRPPQGEHHRLEHGEDRGVVCGGDPRRGERRHRRPVQLPARAQHRPLLEAHAVQRVLGGVPARAHHAGGDVDLAVRHAEHLQLDGARGGGRARLHVGGARGERALRVLPRVHRERRGPPALHAHVGVRRRRVVPHLLDLHGGAGGRVDEVPLEPRLQRADAPALHLLGGGGEHEHLRHPRAGQAGGRGVVRGHQRHDVAHLLGVPLLQVAHHLLGAGEQLLLEGEVLRALLEVENHHAALRQALLDHALHRHVRDALHLGDVGEVLEGDGVERQLHHRHLRVRLQVLLHQLLQPAAEHLHKLGLADARPPVQVELQVGALRQKNRRLVLHARLRHRKRPDPGA